MRKTTFLKAAVCAALLSSPALAQQPQQQPQALRFDSGVISGLGARNIGSAQMSGRISALAVAGQGGKTTVFVGSASGGVWKSTDGATTFKPVFDKQPVQSIGAVALDPRNPDNVWVGTGEAWTRNSVSVGNGVYRSTDGGETWAYLGLPETERIVKILVHPRDSNVAYVCAPGKLWSDSPDRGLYKTTDGGKTWAHVLKGANLSTGCSGLSMDPKNPELLYAGLWDFRRKGWTFRSGGDGPEAPSGSALLRSADGGRTWTALTEKNTPGLPKGPWGRVEVEVAPSDASRVYAFIEGVDPALFVSSDGGKRFEKRDKSQMMVWRPFYFANLVVDPTNADRVFKTNLGLIVSEDGGRSFSGTGGGAHGDWHDVWIDPRNPKHLIGGDDGGLFISHDGGNRWVKNENLPISQFYHVAVDDLDPYRVYGGLQDNGSWMAESSFPGGVSNDRWQVLYGGDGFWVLPDPSSPDHVYAESQGGYLGRVDLRTRNARDLQPKAGYGEKLRFNWNAPLHLSPNEKGTLYLGAQFLFRTRDHGQSWQRISPDLTTNDPEKQKQEESGGITVDNSSAEMHTTIYSISESPKGVGVIWVGTDDGNVQLTRDGGKTWADVTKALHAGLPAAGAWISTVEASRHEPATAYVTVDRHTFGDLTPYVFRTRDLGRTWQRIAGPEQGLRGYAHVVKEDLVKKDLLYVGTEFGLWVSPDGGGRWAQFKGGDFPSVAVRDIALQARERDVVLATHGRGIWVIDDVTPLRELSDAVLQQDATFLAARPVQQRIGGMGGWVDGDAKYTGPSAPSGAVITYFQKTRHLFGPLKLEVLDAQGKVVDTLAASVRRGINRVTWNMRVAPPRTPRAAQLAYSATQGPRVLPGRYTVRLTKGTKTYTTPLDIGLDRRADYTLADRKAQYEAAMGVHALFGKMTDLNDRILQARTGAERAAARAGTGADADALRRELGGFAEKAEALRKKIVATKEGGAITGEERLREHADSLYGALMSHDGRPGAYHLERLEVLQRELDDVGKAFAKLTAEALPGLNERLKGKGLPVLGAYEPAAPGPTLGSAELQALPAFERLR